MLDLTESIAPRSDQLNAEDLLTGPRTFTITEVRKGSAEQPFDFHLAEFPGRPYKPSKTMRRILVTGWGKDASAYAGRRLTLYREPTVKFGGQEVGGIRISHMSHLTKPFTIALAVTKGRREMFTVQPLADAPAGPSKQALSELGVALKSAELNERETALAFISQTVGRDVQSTKALTDDEARQVIAALTRPTAPAVSTSNVAGAQDVDPPGDDWPPVVGVGGTEEP